MIIKAGTKVLVNGLCGTVEKDFSAEDGVWVSVRMNWRPTAVDYYHLRGVELDVDGMWDIEVAA